MRGVGESYAVEGWWGLGGEGSGGGGDAVGIGDVGFDVEDGGAVEKVAAAEVELGAVNFLEFNNGESDGVGAKVGAGGKDTESFVSAKARGADGGFPWGVGGLVEEEDDPEMGELFEPAQGIGGVEGGQKFEGGGGTFHETGLSGNSKFFVVAGVENTDGLKGDGIFHDGIMREVGWGLSMGCR